MIAALTRLNGEEKRLWAGWQPGALKDESAGFCEALTAHD